METDELTSTRDVSSIIIIEVYRIIPLEYNFVLTNVYTCSTMQVAQHHYTLEPPNKEHLRTSYFFLYREVFLSLEVENVLVLWENAHLGP